MDKHRAAPRWCGWRHPRRLRLHAINSHYGGGWYGDHMAPLHAVLDDEVVFLYKAARGACTDSFGSHCAAQANMPRSVIQRARHVSKRRLEGRPIERFDVDSAAAEATEKQLATLVDTFLHYDFLACTAGDFFLSVDPLMQPALKAA